MIEINWPQLMAVLGCMGALVAGEWLAASVLFASINVVAAITKN